MTSLRRRCGVLLAAPLTVSLLSGTGLRSVTPEAYAATAADVYDTAVLADGPIGYWPLRENAGPTVGDRVGGNEGTVEGSAALGIFLGPITATTALDLGGGPCDGVNLDADATNLHPGDAVSVEAWIRTTDPRPSGVLFRARNGGYNLLAGASGVDLVRYPADRKLHVSTVLNDGRWHDVVGTYGADGYHIYVDGLVYGFGPNDGALGYFGNEAAIGRDGHACDGVVPSFAGDIADVAVYPTVLTADQVTRHYQAAGSTAETPTYVALGDSFASGEGAADSQFLPGTSFPDPKVGHGATTGCHRSTTSWANAVFANLQGGGLASRFSFVACSGAVFDNLFGTNTSYSKVGETENPQLTAVNPQTRVATLSMGGNDVGFSTILQNCVAYPLSPGGYDCRSKGHEARKVADAGLDALRNGVHTPSRLGSPTSQVAEIYATIAGSMAPNARLIVVGYPHLFSKRAGDYDQLDGPLSPRVCKAGTADGISGITIKYEDAVWIDGLADAGDDIVNKAVNDANGRLAAVQSTARITFVDTRSPEFNAHGVCSGQRWFNGIQLAGQFPPQRKQTSFHPNQNGQNEYARLVNAATDTAVRA